MATFRMIRRGLVMTSVQVEAANEIEAEAMARLMASEEGKRSRWRVDHDEFDRARDDGPDTTEADAQDERDQDRRWEPRLAE